MPAWAGGKGSSQRKVDKKRFEDNWDRIFGRKDENEACEQEGSDTRSEETEDRTDERQERSHGKALG